MHDVECNMTNVLGVSHIFATYFTRLKVSEMVAKFPRGYCVITGSSLAYKNIPERRCKLKEYISSSSL